ncbi:MAG TPA: patatin-like protein [Chthoniobacterales bacterium]|nr:patatin-like protein [Chthoniobacterales bacterium]
MYGGVSLAIYINGVTQELLHMVRATARKAREKENEMLFDQSALSPTEKVYRDLARRLDQKTGFGSQTADGRVAELTRTRFIVDIISGTSAGGINGVFLAKALARNQTMDGLKSLWLREGDLGKLLNDTKAEDYAPELGFGVQKPEKSLLNSQRMYRKLLQALAEMNQKPTGEEVSAEQEPSPLVKELDLFVTTTDIEGIPLPMQLADGVAYERRYRNVFHFRYADQAATQHKRDDFLRKNDPFLAFAARCTSSFPFAFDAMQLADIQTVLSRYQRYESDDPHGGKQWDGFIKDYLRLGLIDIDRKARGSDASGIDGSTDDATDELREAFRTRSFGDGGYLDNKPFSYATSMLMRRSSDCLVDRKLLYVEPTPEHPELAPKKPGPRPDFAQNVRAAVLDLPREETIREDIERIYERNAIVKRVGSFAKYVDEDAMAIDLPKPMSHGVFAKKDLRQMMRHGYGACYGAYHRLKVHEITELLSCLVTRALGHDPASNVGDAIRELVAMWRNDQLQIVQATWEKTKRKKASHRKPIPAQLRHALSFTPPFLS